MNKKIIITLIFFLTLLSTELMAKERGRHVLVIKTGHFQLDKKNQSSARIFTRKSNAVFGAEYEWHMWKGLSIGGEFFHYENNFSATNNYKAEISAHLFNLKYHFNNGNSFQPFIGIGKGVSIIAPTGESIIDSHVASASQLVAGFTYRFKYAGIYAEYKNLKTKPTDKFYNTTSEIDAGGKGFLLGVSVLF